MSNPPSTPPKSYKYKAFISYRHSDKAGSMPSRSKQL